ncbi:dipeptidase [bacterium]|jgi:membrane dipeptidase|nr:dipeptidase [bacterium]
MSNPIPPLNREFPPIFDGHEDFITQIKARGSTFGPRGGRDFFADGSAEAADAAVSQEKRGHVDLPRAMKGGLGGCFTSIYLTNERAEYNALAYAMDEMNDVFRIADASDGRFRICRTVADIRAAWANDAFASVFMFEGADPISWSLKELRVFYEAGLRLVAPTWSRSTIFAHGVAFRGNLPQTGLTDLGRELVHECNSLGIILDVSHINPAGFWDMLEESSKPVLATHSSVKAVSPHVRNLSDDQLRALAQQGGTVGINFANMFLRPDMQGSDDTALDVIISHFQHIIDLVGDEHVSFGTDFDGTDIPAVIHDATGLPLVLREFKRLGYSDDRIERICNANFLRVAAANWLD